MATHLVKEDKQNDAQVNAIRQSSDSEEEEFEDRNWDDWNEEDDGVEEQELNLQLLCLFCDSQFGSCSSLFEHCASAHFFDFYGIKKAYKLDFYKCFKLINYVRSQVAVNKCWSCGAICISMAELQKHLHGATNFDGSTFPWDDDRYLNPFLQDDSLLYSFDEDEEDEEGDAISVDRKELASYLSQFEQIDIHDEGASNVCGSELRIACENGGKDVVLTMTSFHFDEIIKVINIDNQVVYDKVSRIKAKGEEDDCYLELDVHSDLYPLLPGEKYRMLISATLSMDGSSVPGNFPEGKEKSLADKFDYVMHGLLYKMSEAEEKKDGGKGGVKVVVYISFGGLQLMLKGDPLKMHKFRVDQRLFLLLRKI